MTARWMLAGADWIAGLSIAGLLLPEAVAYSGIAGAPPQAGVIALFAGLLVYGLLGTSRFAIVSSTSSSAAVLLAATGSVLHVSADHRALMGVAMVLVAGVMFVLAGLLRLGGISQFIAKPVLRGFAIGLALTIVVKQLPLAVGVHPAHSDFLHFSRDLIALLPRWNWYGLTMLLVALLALRLLARWKAVPGALLVIAAGIALDALGFCRSWGIAPVGSLQLGAAHLALPELDWADWLRVGQLAVALALILYAESYSSIRSLALRHGDGVNSNRDLLALGGANMASALLQGLPVGAGFSASSANEVAGAQTKAAGLIACAVVAVLVWQLLPWMERIPEPLLAAIVIHAVAHSLNWRTLQPYFIWQRDRAVALTAFAAVIVLGVLDGLLLAMVVSIVMLLKRMAQSHVSELGRLVGSHDFVDRQRHPEAQPVPGLLILRPEESLFFGNAEAVMSDIRARVAQAADVHAVVLSLEESPDLDSTGIEALGELARQLQQAGVLLRLARVKDSLRELLQRVQMPGLNPDCYSAWSVDDAVQALTADFHQVPGGATQPASSI